ncbi:MAG: hypothetical protein FWF59_01545 [Turicibacter sp.]|nr:hypothetical protein [Turicibacter sp.]
MRKILSMDIFTPEGKRDVEYMISEHMTDYDHVFYFQEFRFETNNNTAFKWADEFYTMTEAENHFNEIKEDYESRGYKAVVKDWYTREIRSWT